MPHAAELEPGNKGRSMPILSAEITIFPDDLFANPTFAEEVSAEAGKPCWWAIYTKSRQEKSLARQLLAHKLPFYLPLIPKDRSVRGRRTRSYVPLFAGYVFLFGNEEDRTHALTTNRISRTLPIADQAGLYRDLRQVCHLIATDAPLTIERRLMPGRRVRVKSGAMMGLEGTVISRRGDCRLLLAVNFLQQGASVAIDDFMLEPLDDPSAQHR